MVDLKKIDAATLQRHLEGVEPELMAKVDQQKLGVLCAGACHSMQQEKPGRGR